MRHLLIVGTLAFAAVVQIETVQAREYPWCARYSWTTYNCGFVSYGQCLATISGVGGRCEPNPRFVPSEPRRKAKHRY